MSAGDRIVAGKYRMSETLGKGGYSWVKKGENIENGEEVALKFTAKGPRWDARDEANIETELQALEKCTKMEHPNVMRIYEVFREINYPSKDGKDINAVLFVLELAEGGELFDILFYTGKLEQDVARTFFHQLMDGMETLHTNGIVHRDIKPQNLLLANDMTLKITDFGLSKNVEGADATMNTIHVGTKGFQSPEQLKGEPYTKATDIFACGVVLFILLAGYPPFEHANRKDYWYKELCEINGKSAKVKKFWKKHRDARIPADAADFIARLIASDPHKRLSIPEAREHPWMMGKKLGSEELVERLKQRQAQVKNGRMGDAEKQLEQQDSVKFRAGVAKKYDEAKIAPDVSTMKKVLIGTYETRAHPDAILDAIDLFMDGKGYTDRSDFSTVAMAQTKEQKLEFEAKIFNNKETGTNFIQFNRIQGGYLQYGKFFNMLLNEAIVPCGVVHGDAE